ncbi:uncharacterized protein AAEQ78_006413 [Lycaon pictus]
MVTTAIRLNRFDKEKADVTPNGAVSCLISHHCHKQRFTWRAQGGRAAGTERGPTLSPAGYLCPLEGTPAVPRTEHIFPSPLHGAGAVDPSSVQCGEKQFGPLLDLAQRRPAPSSHCLSLAGWMQRRQHSCCLKRFLNEVLFKNNQYAKKKSSIWKVHMIQG